MPQLPEIQQHFAPQQQANQLLHCQTTQAKPEQLVCTTKAATPTLLPQLDPATLMQYGGITAAIILSIAFLVLSLAEYNKVFVPVMLQKPDNKD
jgi:hypothetical protein